MSLNTVSIIVTVPFTSKSPEISALMAPPFLEEVTFVNSQFSMYTSSHSLRLIAPAVMSAFKLLNLELIIESLERCMCNAGE